MYGLWRAVKSIWSVVEVVHGVWSLLFLGATGWLLGSTVLSSIWLGALLAVVLPIGLIVTLHWDRNRRSRLSPAHRLFVGSAIDFELVSQIGVSRFRNETWIVIKNGPALVSFAHQLSRWIAPVRRGALSNLVRDQERVAASAAIQTDWISLFLVIPGRVSGSSVVVDGKQVRVVDLVEAEASVRNGLHAPAEVRARLLSVFGKR